MNLNKLFIPSLNFFINKILYIYMYMNMNALCNNNIDINKESEIKQLKLNSNILDKQNISIKQSAKPLAIF